MAPEPDSLSAPSAWAQPIPWRQLLLSLVLLWHALAVVVGPMPPSYLMSQVYPLFRPYLQALRLENSWGFFAPDPTAGRFLRYRVIDRLGHSRGFALTEAVSRRDPAFLRITTLSTSVDEGTPELLDSIAAELCRRHGVSHPVRIELVSIQLARLTPVEFERGERVLDPARLQAQPLPQRACPR